MTYCSEEDVYNATGMNSSIVQELSGKTEQEVTSMINSFISQAEARIKRELKIPITIRKERHVGDGHIIIIPLGPQDDEFGIFDYDPENKVEEVYAVYHGNRRVKLPYPKDCDELTEQTASSWTGSNATISDEQTEVKCGSYSIKIVFSSAGEAKYPSSANLAKKIKPWKYIAFWFKSSDASVKFQLRLYDKDGNYEYHEFTVEKANVWYPIRLAVEDFTGSIDWAQERLYQIGIHADKACTVYFDNFNFNDGWWWSYPSGTINYGRKSDDKFSSGDVVYVTYGYDPFKVSVPAEIQEACACLAGVKLIEYLIGARLRTTAFEVMSQTVEPPLDKFTLENLRTRLIQRYERAMASFGYGFVGGLA